MIEHSLDLLNPNKITDSACLKKAPIPHSQKLRELSPLVDSKINTSFTRKTFLSATGKIIEKSTYARQRILRHYDFFGLLPLAFLNFFQSNGENKLNALIGIPLSAAFGVINLCAAMAEFAILSQATNSLERLNVIKKDAIFTRFLDSLPSANDKKIKTEVPTLINHLTLINTERKSNSAAMGLLKLINFIGHTVTLTGIICSPVVFLAGIIIKTCVYITDITWEISRYAADYFRDQAYNKVKEKLPLTDFLKYFDITRSPDKINDDNKIYADTIYNICENLPKYCEKEKQLYDRAQDLIEASGFYDNGELLNEIIESSKIEDHEKRLEKKSEIKATITKHLNNNGIL
jgi:hypothetical protein